MDTDELQKIERASFEIDKFIERRAEQRITLNAEAMAEKEQERSYLRRQNGDHRAEWVEFYRTQIEAAESMRERAIQRLGKLIDGGAGG